MAGPKSPKKIIKKPQPLIDKIMLGPLEKYEKYDKFPWKMLMHICVLIFSTAQILLVFNYTGVYSRAQERVFHKLFMDSDGVDPADIDSDRAINFYYNLGDIREHIEESVETYYGIKDMNLIEQYGYVNYINETTEEKFISQPIFNAYFIRGEGRSGYPNLMYNFTTDYLGPFGEDDESLRLFLSNLTHFQIQYELKSFIPSESITPFDCFRWEIIQNFDFSERNHIYERLIYNRYFCTDEETGTDFMTQYIWLSAIVLIFSVCSLALQVNYLKQISNQYNNIRSQMKVKADKKAYKKKLQSLNQNNQEDRERYKAKKVGLKLGLPQTDRDINAEISISTFKDFKTHTSSASTDLDSMIGSDELDWSSLTFSDRLRMLNGWTFVVIVGDVVQIIGCAFYISLNKYSYERSGPLLGFAAFCHWCATLKYMSNLKAYNIITRTLSNSWLLICKSVFGVIPLLFGFMLFGMCIFVQSNRFNTISVSFCSLYALMNGDSIWDIYYDIQQLDFLIGSIYMYVFIFCSICIIQNTFVVIVGDAYAKSHQDYKYDDLNNTSINYAEKYAEDPLAPFYDLSEKEIRSKTALNKMLQLDKDGIMREYKKLKMESRTESVTERMKELERKMSNIKPSKSMLFIKKQITKSLIKISDTFENQITVAKTNDEKEDIYDRYIDACERIRDALDNLNLRIDEGDDNNSD